MASSASQETTLTVSDICSLSHTEFTNTVKQFQGSDNHFKLPVDGFRLLSEHEKTRAVERLRLLSFALVGEQLKRPKAVRQTDLAESDGLDIVNLSGWFRRLDLKPTPTPNSWDPSHVMCADIEWPFYHDLIEDGGRPAYPFDLVMDVYCNPGKYAYCILPWEDPISRTRPMIFETQLSRWKDFRKWQKDNRGRHDEQDSFLAYVERHKKYLWQHSTEAPKRVAEIEADPTSVESLWRSEDYKRRKQRRRCREPGCERLDDYAAAVKHRLALHGFEDEFQLEEDPSHQNDVTTWIEYLNYEYWWLDRYANLAAKAQLTAAGQEPKDVNMLMPHEVTENIHAYPQARQSNENVAAVAVNRAKKAERRVIQMAQKEPHRSRIQRNRLLKNASNRVQHARERHDQMCLSHETVAQIDWRNRTRKLEQQRVLVQWVLEQLPLVLAERDEAMAM